jgi:FKBP-type peptidyl-prolyl cis-trans isomerase SlyD
VANCAAFNLLTTTGGNVNIGPDTVVLFHYTLRDEAGAELESSRGSDPAAYLHGADNIIPGLEKAMADKAAGDVFSATVEPGEAYGEKNDERVQRVPIKHLVFKGKLKVGDVAQLNTREGKVAVTVVKAGRHSADVDTNHPLAGKTLTFDVEVMEVREASAEEIAHRHVHGPGGHHH